MNTESSALVGPRGAPARQATKTILVVLSDEQRDEYKADFDALAAAGIELAYTPSGEEALDELATIEPALVIVGMTTDTMDGLELVALLMRRYPTFERKVIVLPEKADPFPPVIQWWDAATGRSTTEESNLESVLALARSLAPSAIAVAKTSAPASSKPAATASVPRAKAAAPRSASMSGSIATPELRPARPGSLKKTSLGLGVPAPQAPAPQAPAPQAPAPNAPTPNLPAPRAPAPQTMPAAPPVAQPMAVRAPELSHPAVPLAFEKTIVAGLNAPPPIAPLAPLRESSADLTSGPDEPTPLVAAGGSAAEQQHVAPPVEAPVFGGSNTDAAVSARARVRRWLLEAAAEWKALPARTQRLLAAGLVTIVLVILGIAVAMSGSSDEDTGASSAPATAMPPAAAPVAALADTPAPQRAAPAPPAADHADRAPSASEPIARTNSDLRQLTTLPLAFERASEAYTVSDQRQIESIVRQLRDALEKDQAARVEVGGHASAEGSRRFNWEIAGRRAAAARAHLEQNGIERSRITLRSYGTVRPLNRDERDENRRVTIRLVSR